MERELVYKNLNIIKEAVKNHLEILVESTDKNSLKLVSLEVWSEKKNQSFKDAARFIISKTIAYSPSVIEEDKNIRDLILSLSFEIIQYFNDRHMANLADLVSDLVENEKKKDALHMDYPSDHFGT